MGGKELARINVGCQGNKSAEVCQKNVKSGVSAVGWLTLNSPIWDTYRQLVFYTD